MNTSIQPEIQPKVAEQEAKSPRKMVSEAIHGQRHTFLLTAVAQTCFSRDSLGLIHAVVVTSVSVITSLQRHMCFLVIRIVCEDAGSQGIAQKPRW